MITDEIRHEIAEEIRSKTLYTRGSLGDWWMRLHEAVTDEEDFPCPAETMAAIADLIDRPTCYDVGGAYKFRCSVCGCTIDIFKEDVYGTGDGVMTIGDDFLYNPSFCPNCGAEVVER